MGNLNEAQRQWLAELARITDGGALIGSMGDVQLRALAGTMSLVNRKDAQSTSATPKAPAARPAAPMGADHRLPRKAKVIELGLHKYQYDFGFPITREQAAKVLFKDGRVPSAAKLLPGPGENSWTLQTANIDDWQATAVKMRAHTTAVIPGKPYAIVDNVPQHERGLEIVEWGDGDAGPPAAPAVDLGFKVSRHYRLDEGKSPAKHVKSLVGHGHGYELVFAKPVMQAQVMDALVGGKDLGEGEVRLKPSGKEPASVWNVHVIGIDAVTALKPPVVRAIAASVTGTAESMLPDLPRGVRQHLLAKTVPQNAKRHPPDVHVWEQEGHLVRVQTDGKGGYYHYETTQLSDDEASNITIRYFMLDQGLPAREAWQEYIKHWDWVHQQVLAGLALALAAGRLPGRAGTGAGSRTPRAMPGRKASPSTAQPKPNSANQPAVGSRTHSGAVSPSAGTRPSPTGIGNAPTAPAPAQRPVQGHPLDSTYPGKGQTVATESSPGRSSPGRNSPSPAPNAPARRLNDLSPRNLPDHQVITIQTPNGKRQLTVGQYRQAVRDAKKWIGEQMQANLSRGVRNHDHAALNREAAARFGLNENWNSIANPYVY